MKKHLCLNNHLIHTYYFPTCASQMSLYCPEQFYASCPQTNSVDDQNANCWTSQNCVKCKLTAKCKKKIPYV